MTVVSHALGRPRPALSRGGDCRARDLDQAREIHGPHRFAATTHCRITNGMLRVTVGASAAVPTLTVEAWRGRVVINDVYEDVYTDTYGGEIAVPSWLAMGTLTIDSPSVSALLTDVRLVRITPEGLTIRLVAPLIADVFVTLRRGFRMVSIQHGSTRPPLVSTSRRVRWTASPSPAGAAALGRVEEVTSAVGLDGVRRFLGALEPANVNAGTFSISVASVTTARFGAGVAGRTIHDRPLDLHRQLADASRPKLVVA